MVEYPTYGSLIEVGPHVPCRPPTHYNHLLPLNDELVIEILFLFLFFWLFSLMFLNKDQTNCTIFLNRVRVTQIKTFNPLSE